MRVVLAVALDLLREALARRWFLALGIVLTLMLGVLALTLRLDVIDGALAATRLFGQEMSTDVRPVDVALRPLYQALAYTIFYAGTAFGLVACSDFAPRLLAPGRIEHLLSLPVRRWELLMGTFVGVMMLSAVGALYGAGGVVLLFGFKTGAWTAKPIVAAALGTVAFSAIYAAMLSTAVFVRSAALGAAVGALVFVAGIIAGFRVEVAAAFDYGWGRTLFAGVTAPIPRFSRLASIAADFAGSSSVDGAEMTRLIVGFLLFAGAVLVVGIWRFEGKDY